MRVLRRRLSLAVLLMCGGASAGIAGQSDGVANQRIVFVCEHGAAKSVIAAAYFNKLAAERGLRERAIYRGASPQAELSVATLKGLHDDGLSVPSTKPAAIAAADVTAATHIFAIGCSLPAHASSSGKAENWTDVPEVSDGYAASRDAIKRHVEQLLDQLTNK
jgi:arsenate reductase (thioredoxin)